jgi:hypothetical protein
LIARFVAVIRQASSGSAVDISTSFEEESTLDLPMPVILPPGSDD